jgi:hypothetical protein
MCGALRKTLRRAGMLRKGAGRREEVPGLTAYCRQRAYRFQDGQWLRNAIYMTRRRREEHS